MLAIKKPSKAVKAFSAGSLAFAIGLMSVAAYMISSLEHENLVFNRAQVVRTMQRAATNGSAEEADAKAKAESTARKVSLPDPSTLQAQNDNSWASRPVRAPLSIAPAGGTPAPAIPVPAGAGAAGSAVDTTTDTASGATSGVTGTAGGAVSGATDAADDILYQPPQGLGGLTSP